MPGGKESSVGFSRCLTEWFIASSTYQQAGSRLASPATLAAGYPQLLDVARVLRDSLGFEMMTCVSGVDMVDHLESLYHFRSLRNNWLLQIRVKVPSENPRVPSLVSIYPSANWLERDRWNALDDSWADLFKNPDAVDKEKGT